ncbi:BEACH domain-containing protein [Actinidia chinensis var. chinensis]|uniref:BEACH domain-containing protein n=1 Tax=Actinidia chinensis var. chinensis TaxID=1590841 RepID=A0A2R6Q7T1_ACTCC|nr:BEACH domain-containing protein [Actinidia chinensis var. chinensis]
MKHEKEETMQSNRNGDEALTNMPSGCFNNKRIKLIAKQNQKMENDTLAMPDICSDQISTHRWRTGWPYSRTSGCQNPRTNNARSSSTRAINGKCGKCRNTRTNNARSSSTRAINGECGKCRNTRTNNARSYSTRAINGECGKCRTSTDSGQGGWLCRRRK